MSTSSLRRHAKSCWGAEAVELADKTKDSAEARRSVAKSQLSRKVTYYMHRQLIKTETRYALYRHCER